MRYGARRYANRTRKIRKYSIRLEVILDATDINEIYINAISRIPETMANFQMRGNNWRFMAVVKLDVNTVTYKPLKGSSYISLPVELANKKAIINMKNDDNKCFKGCIRLPEH